MLFTNQNITSLCNYFSGLHNALILKNFACVTTHCAIAVITSKFKSIVISVLKKNRLLALCQITAK